MRRGVILTVRRSPTLLHAAKCVESAVGALRRVRWRMRRRKLICRYLTSHEVRKLELGTGPLSAEGWLGSDLSPSGRSVGGANDVIYLDATRRFPFGDMTFDYIHSEHMIEHLSFDAARAMLAECARVLRDGGRIRVATPDLSRLLALYAHRDNPSPDEAAYVAWIAREMLGDPARATPVFVLNNAFRAWGHAFLFDEDTLRAILLEAGFGEVRRYPVGVSDDPHLSARERHGQSVENERANAFETLVLEAVRTPRLTR